MRQVPDPYRALGLPRGATEAEIKAAHRRLAKRYHPDSAGGDTERFLQVQEAYKLLADPLRRREWDARHAPGPVRASESAAARARARPRAANGRWTKAEQAAEPPAGGQGSAASGRDPASRTYTWSASEVPWWEEGGARENRRQPGRRRPREAGPSEEATAAGGGTYAAQDFDVYNRSSGAAWSMAARAYFRRGDADLPRRGSFRRQGGSQPLTAARARAAAEEEAREEARRQRAAESDEAGRAAHRSGRPAAGVVHDAERIAEIRAAARDRLQAARWPSLPERLAYALIAWLPVIGLIAYGGAWAGGCEVGSPECPAELRFGQVGLAFLALGLLMLLPRVAYALTIAAAGVLLVVLALAFFVPPRLLLLGTPLLLLAQLAIAAWILSSGSARPWAARRITRNTSR